MRSCETHFSIIELGCGQGLPGCTLIEQLAHLQCKSKVEIVFQDYDQMTIDTVTKPFVGTRLSKLSPSFHSQLTITYIASSWEELKTATSFDIILSSECIYREDLFPSFSHILVSSLASPAGRALVAGKRYYFGCGGGTIEFCEYLTCHYSQLETDLVHTIENGMSNTREILDIHYS